MVKQMITILVLSWTMMGGGISLLQEEGGEHAVTAETVKPAIFKKRVKKLLAGKTFYFVNNEGHCEEGSVWLDENESGWGILRFNAAVTRMRYREIGGTGEKGVEKIRIVPNGIRFTKDQATTLLSIVTKKFLQLEDDDGYFRLFYKKSDAYRYLQKLRKRNSGFSSVMLVGKTFYAATIDTFEHAKLEFTQNMVTIDNGTRKVTLPYEIDKDGSMTIHDPDGIRVYLRRAVGGYLLVDLVSHQKEPSYNRTRWFRKVYGRGVGGFHNQAEKLARVFVDRGLMGHTVTQDGRIVGKNFDGYWEAEANRFEFALPVGDHLVDMRFKLEGNKLYLIKYTRHNVEMRLYEKASASKAFLRRLKHGDGRVDLDSWFRGHTRYMNMSAGKETKKIAALHCDTNGTMRWTVFNTGSGKFDHETFDYRIDENRHELITIEKGEKEYHRIVDHGKGWILIREREGDATYLYTTRLGAIDGMVTADECGNEDEDVSYHLDRGHVSFLDDHGDPISVPEDAWVRIVPKSAYDQDEWNMRLSCKVESNGTFKESCWVHREDRERWDKVLADSNERYQIVVFKNNKMPDAHNWDCGEDVYKYVGQDLVADDWREITVIPDDYEDRSGETCGTGE